MDKATRTAQTAQSNVFGLIETIDRLGEAHQERLLRIIALLADASTPAQQAVQQMLRRFVDDPPGSVAECVAEVDAVIAYLECRQSGAEHDWEQRHGAPTGTAGALRYN